MWILAAVGFTLFLCLLVWLAFKFEDWSEREADKQDKERVDLQRALYRANAKVKGAKFSKKWIK